MARNILRTPSFDVTAEDAAIIDKIADRAWEYEHQWPDVIASTKLDWQMDVTACHANGMRLDLAGLLKADNSNFLHDVFGIRRHLDRMTGKLGGCFLPRYAAK